MYFNYNMQPRSLFNQQFLSIVLDVIFQFSQTLKKNRLLTVLLILLAPFTYARVYHRVRLFKILCATY